MKKLFNLLAFVMPFLAISCVDSMIEPEPDFNKDEKVTITLHSAAPTKTMLVEDTYVVWEPDDVVYINDNLYTVVPDEMNPELAYVYNVPVAESYTAYYASSFYVRYPEGLVLTLNPFQNYREGSFDTFTNAMVAQSSTTELYFYNAASILKLGVKGDVTIKEMSISGNNNEKMSGYFLVSDEELEAFEKEGYDGIKNDTVFAKRSYVNYYMEEGLALTDTPQYLYVVVPPQTYEKGFTVTILDSEGRVGIQTTNKSVTTVRSEITKMTDFSFQAAEALSITNVTPGQTDVDFTITGQENARIMTLAVLKEVWDSYNYESEQLKASDFLYNYGILTSLAGGEMEQNVNRFVNRNGNRPLLASAHDYVLLTTYVSGSSHINGYYPVGNAVIQEFTTLEASGEAPEISATPIVNGTEIYIDIFVSENTESIQWFWDPTEAVENRLANGYDDDYMVNMWGGVATGEAIAVAKNGGNGFRISYPEMEYGEDFTYFLRAATATGADKIIRLDVATEEGIWGVVGDVNNWGSADAEGNVMPDIEMEAVPDSEHIFVARNLTLPEGCFKLRKNNTWNNYANLGLADSDVDMVNVGVPVICSGNSSDMYVPAGTYDVYLDEKNLLVYVMTAGTDMTEALVMTSTASEIHAGIVGGRYAMTGYISAVDGAEWGNYYLRDYTGAVYVYGTLNEAGESKKFAEMGINEGDIVTVVGPMQFYGDKVELVNVNVLNHTPVTAVTVSEFLGKPESNDAYYRLTGTVKNLKEGDQYGNFDIFNGTDSVYVYGVLSGWGGPKGVFKSLGVQNGDEITIVGVRGSYNGKDEVLNAFYVSHKAVPKDPVEATIAEFLAAPVDARQPYILTGTIANLSNTTYGNFDLVDDANSVHVYGLTATQVVSNDKSFSTLGLEEGDIVTLTGFRSEYAGNAQVGGPAYYMSHVPVRDWYLVGTFNEWTVKDENYKMVEEGGYYVYKSWSVTGDAEVKFNKGSWAVNRGGAFTAVNEPVDVVQGGSNIMVPAGTYDVYMNMDGTKAYFMTEGKTPSVE